MKILKMVVVFVSIILGGSLLPGNAAQKHLRSASAERRQTVTSRLGNVGQFKEAFQKDAGKVRLVALVSPT